MRSPYGFLLSGAAVLAVSCGGSSNTATPSSTPALNSATAIAATSSEVETKLAQSMLITLVDFPAGTIEKPRTPPRSGDPVAACQQSHPVGSSGYADTAEFSRGTSASDIEERIYVFSSSVDALAWLGHYKTQLDCIVSAINAGSLDSGTVSNRDAAVDPISFRGPPETQSTAYRVKFTSKGSATGREVTVTIDTILVVVGRAVYSLDGGPFGYSGDELTPYLTRATSKIAEQLK